MKSKKAKDRIEIGDKELGLPAGSGFGRSREKRSNATIASEISVSFVAIEHAYLDLHHSAGPNAKQARKELADGLAKIAAAVVYLLRADGK